MQTSTSFAAFVADVQAPANQRPNVGRTARGIDFIQITAPTAGGVSRNAYTDFSVPQAGVVLNNAYAMSQTKLAGFVPGNPNLARGHASVIVNEVTSANPTDMNGFLEVSGNKAAVVVANPNGITVDGGGFINTSQGLLTTGRPEYDPTGNLQHIRVMGGTVKVTGTGLNAMEADKLAILSRAVQLNAGVWAKEMAVRTGSNVVHPTTLESTPLAPTEAMTTAPAVSLDVAAIGGMYANQISLVGTEAGVGVNMAGHLQGTDQLTLDTKGNLVHSGTTLAGKAATITANQVNNTGALTSAGTLTVGVQSDLTLAGTMASNGDMHLTSSGDVHNKTDVTAGGTLTVSGNNIENTNTHALTGNAVTVQAKDSVTNTGLINSATKTNYNGLDHTQQSISIQEKFPTIHQYLFSNIESGKVGGTVEVLKSALEISRMYPEYEAGENDFIYTFNRTAKFLGLYYRYQNNLGMTHNLENILSAYYNEQPSRVDTGIGVGLGVEAKVFNMPIGIQYNTHVEKATNDPHLKLVEESSINAGVGYNYSSIVDLNDYANHIPTSDYFSYLQTQSKNQKSLSLIYGRVSLSGNTNKDIKLETGISAYFGAGGTIKTGVNISALGEKLNIIEKSDETKRNESIYKILHQK